MPRPKLTTFADMAVLRKRARNLSRRHGHLLGAFAAPEAGAITEVARCSLCGLYAGVNPSPTNGCAPTFGAATVTRCVNAVERRRA